MKKILLTAMITALTSYASASSYLEVVERFPGVYVFTAVTDTGTLSAFATFGLVFTADPGTTFSLCSGGTCKTKSGVVALGGNLNAVSYYFDADWTEIPPMIQPLEQVRSSLKTLEHGAVERSIPVWILSRLLRMAVSAIPVDWLLMVQYMRLKELFPGRICWRVMLIVTVLSRPVTTQACRPTLAVQVHPGYLVMPMVTVLSRPVTTRAYRPTSGILNLE